MVCANIDTWFIRLSRVGFGLSNIIVISSATPLRRVILQVKYEATNEQTRVRVSASLECYTVDAKLILLMPSWLYWCQIDIIDAKLIILMPNWLYVSKFIILMTSLLYWCQVYYIGDMLIIPNWLYLSKLLHWRQIDTIIAKLLMSMHCLDYIPVSSLSESVACRTNPLITLLVLIMEYRLSQ